MENELFWIIFSFSYNKVCKLNIEPKLFKELFNNEAHMILRKWI
jgi:hypothetical protein